MLSCLLWSTATYFAQVLFFSLLLVVLMFVYIPNNQEGTTFLSYKQVNANLFLLYFMYFYSVLCVSLCWLEVFRYRGVFERKAEVSFRAF